MLTNPTRSHLIQDLQPYTCTAFVCPEGDNKPLNTWEEWLVHEQVHHRMEYICSDHPAQSFPNREQYIDHIASAYILTAVMNFSNLKKSINMQKCLPNRSTDALCALLRQITGRIWTNISASIWRLWLSLGLPLATGLQKDEEKNGVSST